MNLTPMLRRSNTPERLMVVLRKIDKLSHMIARNVASTRYAGRMQKQKASPVFLSPSHQAAWARLQARKTKIIGGVHLPLSEGDMQKMQEVAEYVLLAMLCRKRLGASSFQMAYRVAHKRAQREFRLCRKWQSWECLDAETIALNIEDNRFVPLDQNLRPLGQCVRESLAALKAYHATSRKGSSIYPQRVRQCAAIFCRIAGKPCAFTMPADSLRRKIRQEIKAGKALLANHADA
jgi:hypothetical protein